MVKHIVFWTLSDAEKSHAQEHAELLRGKFKALLGVVDGLEAIEVGVNYNGGEFDLALDCTFTTREAEAAYQKHPGNLAIKKIVHSIVAGRACIDYEI